MSPPSPTEVIAEVPIVNELSNSIEQLFAALDVYIPDGPEVDALMPNATRVQWQNVQIGHEYWICSTGFGGSKEPRRFTVREIWTFPDGGAMICTTDPIWAFGVGATCESAIGPRNRFWMADRSQT